MSDEKRICLGQITGAHGIRGEIRIRAHTEVPEDITAYGPLESEAGDRRFALSGVRPTKGGIIARVDGVGDRNQAEALKGALLYVDRDKLPEQGDGTWYHADLIGLVALDGRGAALGEIVAVPNYGAGDLLEIRPSDGGATVLVPFTEEVVPDVDLASGWLLVVPPEGLFEE